jgi:hypothetical protein
LIKVAQYFQKCKFLVICLFASLKRAVLFGFWLLALLALFFGPLLFSCRNLSDPVPCAGRKRKGANVLRNTPIFVWKRKKKEKKEP